jgi:hypothetical protein
MKNVTEHKASEHEECRVFWQWLQYCPATRGKAYHIPNEGKRSLTMARRLKAIGLCPGVPDYFIAVPVAPYHGLYIEMKSQTGILALNQAGWLRQLNANEYYATVCFGAEQAIAVVKDYLTGKL